jgi:hypothetical protein
MALKRGVIPSRSAPLETLAQPVREITPPVNQGAPEPKPAADKASGSGSRQEPYVPPHRKQESEDPTPAEAYGKARAEPAADAKPDQSLTPIVENDEGWTEVTHKKKKGRALPPPLTSTHQMSTRNRLPPVSTNRQGGQVAAIREAPTINPRGAHLPVNPESWNRLKGQTSTLVLPRSPTKRSEPRRVPFNIAQAAATTVAAAIALLPTARAQPFHAAAVQTSAFEDEGVFWTQVAAALAIWVLFVLTRYLARNRAWSTCFVKIGTTLASVIWTQQLLGIRVPTAVLWRRAIAAGTATPALVTVVTMCALFAHIWSRREQNLFKRARRL